MRSARYAEQKMPVYVDRIVLIVARNFLSTLVIQQKFAVVVAKKKSTWKIIEVESHDIEGCNGVLYPIYWGFFAIFGLKHPPHEERPSPNLYEKE